MVETPLQTTHTATPAPEALCEHCGLPVGRQPVGTGPYFCCTGCEVVNATLQEAGFGATYYKLRGTATGSRAARPARIDVDALLLSEVDGEAFLDEHTTEVEPGLRRVDLFLDGVHCAACVWLVERLPFELEGVVEATLDLPRARLTVVWRPAAVALSAVVRWLASFGYSAHPVRGSERSGRTNEERRLLVRVGICWALAGNVMLLAFAFYAGLDVVQDPLLATGARWLSLLLAVPAVVLGAGVFFKRAWAALRLAVRSRRLRVLHMDTPIALGLLVGMADSTAATVTGQGDVWFDSLTVLIAALLTARWLQLRSRRLAGDATERLLALVPSMAYRVEPDGTRTTVRVDELGVGDRVAVPAGEVVPVDGEVVAGQSTLNKAVLTGEPRPEPVAVGDAVPAGATNLSAALTVRVEAAGDETRVGRLLVWVRDAAEGRAPVELLADRLSGVFVATVLTLAAVTAGLWAFLDPTSIVPNVVALLVITCPCALGMATPLALAVSAGQAARQGIYIKTDAATQQLATVDTVVLDKTGTLTEGQLTLVDWHGEEEAVDLAAVLETVSTHPVALALVQARRGCRSGTDTRTIDAHDVVTGQGVRGRIGGRDVWVGRPAWVVRTAGLAPAPMVSAVARFAADGLTPVAVAVDGSVRAVLGFGDRVRPDAASLVASLQRDGVGVHLLSGDHPDVVQRVAARLGIPQEYAHGHVSPERKKTTIERLRADGGRIVAMVGDGVNDAAALQAADVGIAVDGGSTASLVAADVFMTRDGIRPVMILLVGARRVLRVIRRNLALSLVYNLLGAAAAIAGLVSPLVAAVAMPISSLLVVASSILHTSFAGEVISAPKRSAGSGEPADEQLQPAA